MGRVIYAEFGIPPRWWIFITGAIDTKLIRCRIQPLLFLLPRVVSLPSVVSLPVFASAFRSLFFLFHPEFVVVIYRMFGLIQATLLLPEVGPPFFF